MRFQLPPLGKEPVPFSHFPSGECAFVFRGLEFFSYEKLAELLGTTAENIKTLGAAMGIYEDQKSDIWIKKGYITIIRSMWHLLPYSICLEVIHEGSRATRPKSP